MGQGWQLQVSSDLPVRIWSANPIQSLFETPQIGQIWRHAWRESTALGFLMNTRGLMELILLSKCEVFDTIC